MYVPVGERDFFGERKGRVLQTGILDIGEKEVVMFSFQNSGCGRERKEYNHRVPL